MAMPAGAHRPWNSAFTEHPTAAANSRSVTHAFHSTPTLTAAILPDMALAFMLHIGRGILCSRLGDRNCRWRLIGQASERSMKMPASVVVQ